jgi:hypothetical protein
MAGNTSTNIDANTPRLQLDNPTQLSPSPTQPLQPLLPALLLPPEHPSTMIPMADNADSTSTNTLLDSSSSRP